MSSRRVEDGLPGGKHALPVPADRHQLATLDQLAAIPEEEIWLEKAKEQADPPRLSARRAALHAQLRHHHDGGTAMAGLTPERIGQVVDAHKLSEAEGDAATMFAQDLINMMVERHLSAKEVACALELLAHLRNDRC